MASSAGMRERKRAGNVPKEDEKEFANEADSKKEQKQEPVDLEPDFKVALALVLAFSALVGAFIYYKVDNRPENNGPFAAFVNNNIIAKIMPKNRYQKG